MRLAAILAVISGKFVMGYHCARLYILFIFMVQLFFFFFSYLNITKLLKFKMAAQRPF